MNPAERPMPEERQTGDRNEPIAPIKLPEIPIGQSLFDDDEHFISVIGPSPATVTDKIQKRASNVMKLAQETEKLKAELKALTDRLEAAEEREGKLMEHPSPRDMHDTLKHP